MLKVTVELIPHGDEARTKQIGYMKIVNDGTGTHEVGNYTVDVDGEEFKVNAFLRIDGVWKLIEYCLYKGGEI